MRVWLKQTFRAMPLPLFHETSTCSLEVCALMRGSLPRPWGEGGRRPGEGSVADRALLLGGLRLLATPSQEKDVDLFFPFLLASTRFSLRCSHPLASEKGSG